MPSIHIRKPKIADKENFIIAMQQSETLHQPWVKAPTTSEEFDTYLERYQADNQISYLVLDDAENIVGVFNINEIVRGAFQSAYLGFYATTPFAGKGYMSAGLKLILDAAFKGLSLHRLEANIQPQNMRSINFIKKNGFHYEGFSPRYLKINNVWCGHERWAMTFEEFIKIN